MWPRTGDAPPTVPILGRHWGYGASGRAQPFSCRCLDPPNVRDSVGKVVDLVANLTSFLPGTAVAAVRTSGGAVGVVDSRANLLHATDSLERNALDYYATLRSVTAQHRDALVAEGKVGAVTDQRGDATLPAKSTVSAGAD
jgi:phospholipid-binding lipoprotein MlaA